MRCRPSLLVAGLIAVIAASALRSQEARADEPLVVSPDVMAGFEEYKHRKKPIYFAVSADGLIYSYFYCSERQCDTARNYRRLAIEECEKLGGADCRIFAVGDEIQVEYRLGDPSTMVPATFTPCAVEAVATDSAEGAIVAALRPGECSDFRRYGYYDHFKAFASTDIEKYRNTWGWSYRYKSPGEAMKRALEECMKIRKEKSLPDPCQVFAIGGIVVHGMTEAELRAAADVYEKNKDATNADLPGGE